MQGLVNRSLVVALVSTLFGCAAAPAPGPHRPTADELYARGIHLRGEGRRREAVQLWERALRIDPNHAESQIALAGALIALHEQARARELLDAAKTQRSADPLLWLEYGRLNIDLHQYVDAVESFGRALQLDAQLHSARIGRLEAYAALGLCDEARTDLEALRKVRPVGFGVRADRLMRNCPVD